MIKNKEDFCAFKHKSTGRFLESCLLCLLKEGDSYGYILLENLSEFGFLEDEVNISIIYRRLRGMEKEGFVSSSWGDSELGPKKRIYKITDLGIKQLDHWILFLGDRKKRISSIIDKYHSLA